MLVNNVFDPLLGFIGFLQERRTRVNNHDLEGTAAAELFFLGLHRVTP